MARPQKMLIPQPKCKKCDVEFVNVMVCEPTGNGNGYYNRFEKRCSCNPEEYQSS